MMHRGWDRILAAMWSSRPLKIALVWNHQSRLLDCSFRFEQYLDGFRSLRHDPLVVCERNSAAGWSGPLEIVETAAELAEPGFWRRLGADVVVIVTWHRMAAVLAAIGAAGTRVIAIADTDGRLSPRVFPGAALERLMVYQDSLTGRLKCLKYWLGRYLAGTFGDSREDRQALASTRRSDALVFGHEQARRNFDRFLSRYRERPLGERVTVVPFAIGASFLNCRVPEARPDRLVAIGRWDDPQKDAGLLAAAIARLLDSNAHTEVVVLGRGGEGWFGPLARRYPRLRYAGVQPQDAVARSLAEARAIVFSSRWEGSPHAALEALALGATVVGPPIPSVVSWTEDGRFGTVSRSRRPASLARAMSAELSAWEEGRRDPKGISRHWRSRLAPAVVCRRMLEALPSV